MWNAGLDEAQDGIKIAGRNINSLIYADDTTLMAESEEKLKSLWWRWKRRVKSWLKTQHSENKDHGVWSHHFMAKQRKTILGGSIITADGDCSHEIKRRLLLGRKVMTNLDSILESRDITLSTNVHLVKAMVFPVVMYGCESWTIKSTEELMLLNCGVGEDSWESLGLQGDPTSPFWRRSALGFLWKEWC